MNSRRETEIKKQAKEILDKFAKALEKVENILESYVERKESQRTEGEGEQADSEFIESFFNNAPQTKNKCILAEKGAWK